MAGGAGLVATQVTAAAPAMAAPGNSVVLGAANDGGTTTTTVTSTPSQYTPVLLVSCTNGGSGISGRSASGWGVDARSTSGVGLAARSDTGTAIEAVVATAAGGAGINATSTGGYGVVAKGARAPLRLVPSSRVGAPTTAAHKIGDLYMDKNGGLFICVGSGIPGTWKQVVVA